MNRSLDKLAKKEPRLIVGIETGNTPGRLGAVVVGVSGSGDNTVLDIHGFKNYTLPAELVSTLHTLAGRDDFDPEEIAGINFLIYHHLTALYKDTLEEVGVPAEEVDLIGLKCIEIGGRIFPDDPSVFSEMTGCIVASRFSIGIENHAGDQLHVNESLLRRMMGSMMERFELDGEVREAAAVALLANEALFHENSEECIGTQSGTSSAARPTVRAVKRTGAAVGEEGACLYGEFFFPA